MRQEGIEEGPRKVRREGRSEDMERAKTSALLRGHSGGVLLWDGGRKMLEEGGGADDGMARRLSAAMLCRY